MKKAYIMDLCKLISRAGERNHPSDWVGNKLMKRIITRSLGIICSAVILALSFGTQAQAGSSIPFAFNFGEQVVRMDAGTTHDVWLIAYFDYTYYIGPHTSAGTYMECTFKDGSEYVRLHIGADETVQNVLFYFYVDDKRLGSTDCYDYIEVQVQKIDPVAVQNEQAHQAAINAMKNYSGNTAEFNAMYYYYNYKDLQDAFGMDPAKLLEHYNTFGKNEHRIANRFI